MTEDQKLAIDALTDFISVFEDPGFEPSVWPKREYTDKYGKRILQMPYPDYHPKVSEFRDAFAKLADGIHPYHALPEADSPDGITFSVTGTTFEEAYFQTATLDQIRRYFALLNRGERFCDGHIDGEIRSGKILAALRRLVELRASSDG